MQMPLYVVHFPLTKLSYLNPNQIHILGATVQMRRKKQKASLKERKETMDGFYLCMPRTTAQHTPLSLHWFFISVHYTHRHSGCDLFLTQLPSECWVALFIS